MDLRSLRDRIYEKWIARKIVEFKRRGGRVVVITGSYGKTSVKELAYDLLRHILPVAVTGRNYNTAVGIAKTIYWEVLPQSKVLILEVGAYQVSEIMRFCRVLKPDIGVITGIARQHLSRFGSWENIITAKTEIAQYIAKNGGILIANGSDETVKRNVNNARWYEGREREEINKSGAKEIAKALGVSETKIKENEKYFRSVLNRFEMTSTRYGMKVIDDSYNSNEKSYLEAIKYLGEQKRYTRVMVTPGLIELGGVSDMIHQDLGRAMIGRVDILILIGENERTRGIERGVGGKVKTHHIQRTLDFMELVKSWKLAKEPLVLIENDVPEVYL